MPTIDLSDYSFDAIIFDCDGTLIDSAPLHYQAFKVVLARQGATLDKQWYFNRLGLSRLELLTEFKFLSSTVIDVARAVAESEAQYLIYTDELKSISEVVDIARKYCGSVPLAIASSGQKLCVCESLNSVGLINLFDYVLTAEDVLTCKPDPEIYITAAYRLKTDIARCLVFEDTNEGIKSATTAGAQVIDVRLFASIYTE